MKINFIKNHYRSLISDTIFFIRPSYKTLLLKFISIIIFFFSSSCGDGMEMLLKDKNLNIVTNAALVSIEVTPSNQYLLPGNTLQYTAVGTYQDLSTATITNSVTWSSSNPGCASISNSPGTNGLASGIAEAIVTITATSGTVSGSTDLHVAHISVMPLVWISQGRTLTITNLYLNGSPTTVVYASPGANITVRAVGDVVNNNTDCPGCITQFYIRLNGVFNLCLGSSDFDWTFDETGNFTAPATPGMYFLNPYSSWLMSCESSTVISPDILPQTVAILIVQ